MRAILCSRHGTPDDLELRTLPEPQPGEDEVLVRVAAAALNFFDTLLIAGKYQVKPDFPFSPAGEFAGTVARGGGKVTAFKPGDRVMGYCGHGGADETVNYATSDLRDELKRLAHGRGIDVIYDAIGDRFSERALRAIAWQG
jgi:NADPH2:quinone reductase